MRERAVGGGERDGARGRKKTTGKNSKNGIDREKGGGAQGREGTRQIRREAERECEMKKDRTGMERRRE